MRKTPYTETGIKRVPCARCGEKSHAQWNICALGGSFCGICKSCDVALNALVLNFIKHPQKQSILKQYKEKNNG